MAVVRFSEELKEAVLANARAMFQPRLDAAAKNKPDVGDEIARLVTEEYMPAVNMLPKDFFQWNQSIDLRSIGGKTYGYEFPTKHSYPVPRTWVTGSDGSAIDSSFKMQVKLPDTPKYEHIKAQIDQWQEGIIAIAKQRDEFVSGVKALLNAHATLAPALKAWPPLWDLVPDKFKERHRKVVERTKPEPMEELGVDLTKLTSTVVASKLIK